MDGIVPHRRIRSFDRVTSSRAIRMAFFLVWALGPGDARAEAAADAVGTQAELGIQAPTCELAALSSKGGFERLRARSFAGKTVLVDFWASWCPTCEHAFPFMNDLARDYRDRGFEVVAVNLDADPRDALEFLARHPVEFEIAHDPTGRCPRAFGLIGMPSAYLIDAEGRIRAVTRGFRRGEAEGLRSRIETLIAEAAGTTPDPALARVASPSRP